MSKKQHIRKYNIAIATIGLYAIVSLAVGGYISQGIDLDDSQKLIISFFFIISSIVGIGFGLYLFWKTSGVSRVALTIEVLIMLWSLLTFLSFLFFRGVGFLG